MMKEVLSPKGNLPILIWTSSCIPRAHFGPAHTGTIECEAAPSPASQATGQLKIKIESQPLPRSPSCLQIKKESDHGNGTVPVERRTERVGEPRAFWQRKRGRVAMTVRAARKRFEHGGFPLMLTGPSPLFTVCSRPSPWQSPPPALSPSVCRGACPPPPDPQTLPGPGLVSYPFTLSTMNCSRHIGKTLAVTVHAGTRAMGREEERWELAHNPRQHQRPSSSTVTRLVVHSTTVVFTHSSCCPYPLSISLPPRQTDLTHTLGLLLAGIDQAQSFTPYLPRPHSDPIASPIVRRAPGDHYRSQTRPCVQANPRPGARHGIAPLTVCPVLRIGPPLTLNFVGHCQQRDSRPGTRDPDHIRSLEA